MLGSYYKHKFINFDKVQAVQGRVDRNETTERDWFDKLKIA